MKTEKQRIKIAEALGGVFKPCACGKCGGEENRWHWPDGTITDDLPDYLNDLNAMHEAEKVLDESRRFIYEATLHDLNLKYDLGISVWETIHATATQRAEAFLKTFGLWE